MKGKDLHLELKYLPLFKSKKETSEKVRHDFTDAILGRLFDKLVYDYKQNPQLFLYLSKFPAFFWPENYRSEQFSILSTIACKKKITQNELKNLAIQNFNTGTKINDALKSFEKDDVFDECINDCCQDWLNTIGKFIF